MADQEVIKHTKNVFKIWSNKEHPIWHKLKEALFEILIIVFAVSISIWLHNWNAHRHEQAQVKTFLLGLKKDIRADVKDAKVCLDGLQKMDTIYRYLSSLKADKVPDKDSLKSMCQYLGTSMSLDVHKSRFMGFLSAGKVITIEDDSLALNILNFYQEIIPSLQLSEGGWGSLNGRLTQYLIDNVKDVDSDMAKWEVLTTSKGRYLTKSLIPWQQLLDRYRKVIVAGETIIKQIDEQYPEEASL
jgi:hypothetical protein